MASFLNLLGVEFPAALGHGNSEIVSELGDAVRAIDGTYNSTRAGIKRAWAVQATQIAMSEAVAWAGLVLGRGHNWRFADGYSMKGLGPTTTTGTVTYNVASGKFGVKVQVASSSKVTFTPTGENALTAGGLNPTGDYTLVVWRLETAVWHKYILVSANSVVSKYKDGASSVAGTTFLTVTSGVVQLGDGTNADDFSDLVVLPYAIPSAWPATWYAYGRQFPALPSIEASGDLIYAPTTPLTVRGSGVQVALGQFNNAGTWQQDGRSISFTLNEV